MTAAALMPPIAAGDMGVSLPVLFARNTAEHVLLWLSMSTCELKYLLSQRCALYSGQAHTTNTALPYTKSRHHNAQYKPSQLSVRAKMMPTWAQIMHLAPVCTGNWQEPA